MQIIMADSRKSDVNASSMIDLKAELFRKQEEFKRLKAAGSTEFVKGRKADKHGKVDLFSRKNAGVLQRAQLDMEKKEEEENIMEKSRRALEAKSKIYDKIAARPGIPEEDGSEGFLVDFQRKAIDRIVEDRRKGESQGHRLRTKDSKDGDSDEESALSEPVPPTSNPDEEWVDYTDSFGRSRRCMKKDLPYLEKQERPLGKRAADLGLKVTNSDSPTLMSEDMRRELRRQQWEKEAQEAAEGPIHYANVQYDEIRTHGVGYYQFSKDSNLREEQMATLNKLREQTMEERMRSERIKEKRKAALEARLAKVKQRRKMKGGSLLVVEENDESSEDKTTEQKDVAAKEEKKAEPEPLTRDDSWRQGAPVREWDKGKEKMPEWNAKRYMEKRRSDREEEFAPPQIYFEPQVMSGKPPPKATPKPRTTTGKHAGETVETHTESMLRELRNSVASTATVSSTQVQGDGDTYLEGNSVVSPADTAGERSRGEERSVMDVDVTAIPLPPTQKPGTELANTSSSNDGLRDDFQGQSFPASRPAQVIGPPLQGVSAQGSQASLPSHYSTAPGPWPVAAPPMSDFSVPPPGWGAAQTPGGFQPAYPSQDTQQNVGAPAGYASSYVDQSAASAGPSHFVYPSQQGLLASEQTLQASKPQHWTSSSSQPPSKATVPKMNLVDKRFMQNRELPIDDLLGEMEDEAILSSVKPVTYQPGIFSKSTVSETGSSTATGDGSSTENPQSIQTSITTPNIKSEKGEPMYGMTDEQSQSSKIPEVKTESVIFGVPDFLQPATGVEAKVYQPGSFMAAKEAAAQHAEEVYEAARRKQQYSSAPVMYARPSNTDEQTKSTNRSDIKLEREERVKNETDAAQDKVEQFLRDLRGGK